MDFWNKNYTIPENDFKAWEDQVRLLRIQDLEAFWEESVVYSFGRPDFQSVRHLLPRLYTAGTKRAGLRVKKSSQDQILFFPLPEERGKAGILLRCPEGKLPPLKKWSQFLKLTHRILAPEFSARHKPSESYLVLVQAFGRKIFSNLKRQKKGTLVHFQLQDLSSYFLPMGKIKSREIWKEILETIYNVSSSPDWVFPLSVRQIYLYCPGLGEAEVSQQMNSLYFPSTHVIIDYDLEYLSLDKETFRLEEFCELFQELD